MSEFVRKEQTAERELTVIGKSGGGDTVVAGLMMLQAEVRDLIAEGYEKMIGTIVTTIIESAGFANESVEFSDVFLGELNLFRSVGSHVEVVFRSDLGSELYLTKIAASKYGRVDKLFQGDSLESRV